MYSSANSGGPCDFSMSKYEVSICSGADLILLDVFPYVVFLRTQSLLFHRNVWVLVNLLNFSAKPPQSMEELTERNCHHKKREGASEGLATFCIFGFLHLNSIR